MINNPLKSTTFSNEPEKEVIINVLKQKIKPGYRDIIVGIPSNYTVLRNLKLPKLKPRELEKAVYWISQEFSPMFNDKFISSYELISEEKDHLHILFAAASEKIVLDYVKIIDQLGLNLLAIDIFPLSGARLLKEIDLQDTIALIDIGKFYSLVNIIEKGKVFFCRQISIGGSIITRKIAEKLQLKINKAESLKKDPKNFKKTIKDTIKPIIDKFAIEILNVFNLYSAQNEEKKVDYIIFIGNGSKLWCLRDMLSSLLKIRVLTPNEIQSLSFVRGKSWQDWNWDYYNFTNAIGFAMRG